MQRLEFFDWSFSGSHYERVQVISFARSQSDLVRILEVPRTHHCKGPDRKLRVEATECGAQQRTFGDGGHHRFDCAGAHAWRPH